jgi:FHA domain-containing protein
MSVTPPPHEPQVPSGAEVEQEHAAKRRGDPYLVYPDARGRQQVLSLPETWSRVVIGRSLNVDLVFPWDEQVSAIHAELQRLGDEWLLVDDGLSRNGSFVNGERVSGRRRLQDGDQLRLGSTEICFHTPRAARETVMVRDVLNGGRASLAERSARESADPGLRTTAGKSQRTGRPLAPDPLPATLRREGDVWAFECDDKAVRLRDSRGVRCLGVLLQNPGIQIHALELGGLGTEGRSRPAERPEGADPMLAASGDDAGPLLDAEAKVAYRRRLDELREDLEEAEMLNDPERASRARAEIDFLGSELASAIGLGGRDRKAASNTERARVRVTRAIRSTIKRIAEHDPILGRELSNTIRTGTFCVYEPDPGRPVFWRVEE